MTKFSSPSYQIVVIILATFVTVRYQYLFLFDTQAFKLFKKKKNMSSKCTLKPISYQ